MAEGTSFEIDIQTSGASGVDSMVGSLSKLSSQLTEAQASVTQASDALRAGEASYKSIQSTFDNASKALEKLNTRIDEQRTKVAKLAEGKDGSVNVAAYRKAEEALARLTVAQGAAAGKVATAKAALDAEAASLDKLKLAATNAKASQDKFAAATEAAKQKLSEMEKAKPTGNLGKIANELQNFGGPLAPIAGKVLGLGDALGVLQEAAGSVGPYAALVVALAAVAAGVATVTAAVIAGIAKITMWGISLADAARTNVFALEAIAGSTQGAEDLGNTIGVLADEFGMSTAELQSMAAQLAKTGLKGAELSKALTDTAAKAQELKFGPNFQKQALSLGSQLEKLKRNITNLFSGLKIDVLLERLASLGELFDSNKESAKAIKVVFESLFQPLIDGVAAWLPKARSAFIQFEIMVLKALIAIKPWGSTILTVVGVLVALSAIILGVLAVAVLFIIANIAILALAFAAVVAAVLAVAFGVGWLAMKFFELGGIVLGAVMGAFNSVLAWFEGFSLVDIGTQMINGLIAGITGAGAGVLSAITGVVGGAVDAAKSALGIASPSKVFAEIGGFTAEGMAQGVDEGATDVSSSLEAMVAPPEAPAGGASAAPAAKSEGGASGMIVNIYAPDNTAQSLFETFENWFAQGGLASAPAA